MEKIVKVNLKEKSYPIFIGTDNLSSLGSRVSSLCPTKRLRIIASSTVWDLYGEIVDQSLRKIGLTFDLLEVPDGEEFKSLEVAGALCEGLASLEALRSEPLVAFGGGVIGDLAGFVAATYMRGVPYIQVPTTLLAQVDSSIGGKVAVNLSAGKNLVGSFYQPELVLIDVTTLRTLPRREFKAGLAEVIKTAFLAGQDFLNYLEKNISQILNLKTETLREIVSRAVRFKAQVVEADERDLTGRRAILNYGHTIGHALEASTEYKQFLHGEAVAIGMMIAARISHQLGLMDQSLLEKHQSLLKESSLFAKLPFNLDIDSILKIISRDKKKKTEEDVFVLLEDVGKPVVRKVDRKIIRKVLREFQEEMKGNG